MIHRLPASSVICATNLGLTFQTADGPVQALSNVELTIGKGEYVGREPAAYRALYVYRCPDDGHGRQGGLV